MPGLAFAFVSFHWTVVTPCWPDCPADEQRERGYLLLHGFTDPPFVTRDLAGALQRHDPCARARAVVLPGHASAPGDLLAICHEEWVRAAGLAIDATGAEVRRL